MRCNARHQHCGLVQLARWLRGPLTRAETCTVRCTEPFVEYKYTHVHRHKDTNKEPGVWNSWVSDRPRQYFRPHRCTPSTLLRQSVRHVSVTRFFLTLEFLTEPFRISFAFVSLAKEEQVPFYNLLWDTAEVRIYRMNQIGEDQCNAWIKSDKDRWLSHKLMNSLITVQQKRWPETFVNENNVNRDYCFWDSLYIYVAYRRVWRWRNQEERTTRSRKIKKRYIVCDIVMISWE